jgi:hypothetical protein
MTDPMTDERLDVDEPCACEDDCACWYHKDEAQNMVREIRRLREENEQDYKSIQTLRGEIRRLRGLVQDWEASEKFCKALLSAKLKLQEQNEELRKFRDADIGQINVLEAENAKLRTVVDAAREADRLIGEAMAFRAPETWPKWLFKAEDLIYKALHELDKGEK